jgi:hypothetical protein
MNEFPTGPDERDDQHIRRLLDEAVSDVEPREALGSIHARTKVSPMRSKRSWLLGAGAAVVATAATVAAVTVLSDGTTGEDPDRVGPAVAGSPNPSAGTKPSPAERPSPSEPASPSEPPAEETQTVPVYYVGDTSRGPRLYREFHKAPGGEPLRAALDRAIAGRGNGPDDPDYRSPWPSGTGLGQASFDGDVVTISLEPPDGGGESTNLRVRPPGMSEDEAAVAIEQLIYTAQAALQEGRPGVQFLINGQHTDRLLGQPASEPLAQGAAVDVLAQVWVIEPSEGAEVTSPFTVSGLAAAFEANVQWELKQGDRVVKEGFTTAEECCTMAPYSFKVTAPPGRYTLVVHDTDPSGGEGFAPWEDTKQVTILP